MKKARNSSKNDDQMTTAPSSAAARAYTASVKLPTLISVAHPSTRLAPKIGLNVEGRSSSTASNSTSIHQQQTISRNSQITALLDNGGADLVGKSNSRKRTAQTPQINVDEIMTMINDKLSTGYHGVEHLFKSNDIHKDGRLSKEAFKWVLNQLCGYMSSEAWYKICSKFHLNERDSISFDEFISHFIDNQKVQKELVSSMQNSQQNKTSLQLVVNELGPTRVVSEGSHHHHHPHQAPNTATKLSAAYCLALLKAKASQSDFDPSLYLPEECLTSSKLIMPYHLDNLLRQWNLELTDSEFDKLWQRFDLNNSGGVRARVFLRLINYRPYQLDELSHNLDLMRTKTCIALSSPQTRRLMRHTSSLIRTNRNRVHQPSNFNDNTVIVDNRQLKENSNQSQQVAALSRSITNLTTTETYNNNNNNNTHRSGESKKKIEAASICHSSLSAESRIKSMVHTLKNSNKLLPGQDLVAFLNNKLNEGYVLMRTAFEYVDEDNFGYLLLDEFRSVLDEFNIPMSGENSVFESLLKKYGLVKKKKLVDYNKFLRVFQEKRDLKARLNNVSKKSTSTGAANNPGLNECEEAILEFFHGSFNVLLDNFQSALNQGQTECTLNEIKRILEQKLGISIDWAQISSLMRFVTWHHQYGDNTDFDNEHKFAWPTIFEKFSSVDPWKLFKETIETARANRSKAKLPLAAEKVEIPTALTESSNRPGEEENENEKSETTARKEDKNDGGGLLNSSDDDDDDDEVRKACVLGVSDDEKEENYSIQKYLQSNDGGEGGGMKQSLQLRRSVMRDELKKIKKLEKKIEMMLRTKFHRMNKAYSIIDSTHTEKIDKAKLKIILEKCNVDMRDDELDLVWKDFEADVVPFSNFVRRFLRPAEFDRIREVHYKRKIEESMKENLETSQNQLLSERKRDNETMTKASRRSLTANRSILSSSWDAVKRPIVRFKMSDSLIQRLRHFISLNSKKLKTEFEREDRHFQASLPKTKALEIFKKCDFLLLKEDSDALLDEFDLNGTEFDYMKFLKHFDLITDSKLNRTLDSLNPVLKQLVLKLRDQSSTSNNNNNNNNNNRDLVNLKTVFKKHDAAKKGFLEQDEFKKLLTSLKIDASSNDMYMIAADYDPELRGVFCYEMFLKSLIHTIVA